MQAWFSCSPLQAIVSYAPSSSLDLLHKSRASTALTLNGLRTCNEHMCIDWTKTARAWSESWKWRADLFALRVQTRSGLDMITQAKTRWSGCLWHQPPPAPLHIHKKFSLVVCSLELVLNQDGWQAAYKPEGCMWRQGNWYDVPVWHVRSSQMYLYILQSQNNCLWGLHMPTVDKY